MKFPHRRRFLHLAAGAAALPFAPRVARAQAYPTRPVRIVVPFAAGGATDIIARLIGQWLSEHLGQQFVIENRPGAGSNIGTEAVAKAVPDGYTLLLTTSSAAINASLYEKLSFNFVRDIAPVAGLIRAPLVVLVNPSVPGRTLPEFIAHAKANPGKLNYASPGSGTTPHVAGELFKLMASIDIAHVPYRGDAPALTDLLAGQVQVYIGGIAPSAEHIRAGRLRALGVTTAARSGTLPDVPAVSEFVSGYEASAWFGVGAPRATPINIVERLNQEINAALADPRIKAGFTELSGMLLPGSQDDFRKLIAAEVEKWAKVVRAANIKA